MSNPTQDYVLGYSQPSLRDWSRCQILARLRPVLLSAVPSDKLPRLAGAGRAGSSGLVSVSDPTPENPGLLISFDLKHLFTAQSDDWIDLRGATRRQPAGQQKD